MAKSEYPAELWHLKNPKKAMALNKRLGIEAPGNAKRPGETGWYENFQDRRTYADRALNAARNDYDLRRTVEAAALSGDKKAQELHKNGFKTLEDLAAWDKWSRKSAKENGQGGQFGNSPTDYMGLTRTHVLADRAQLEEKIGKSAPEEVKEPEEPTQPKEVSMPYHVAQSMAAIDTFHANEGNRLDRSRTRGEFAQKLRDDYVGRLTQYSGTYKDGEQPWLKAPVAEGEDPGSQHSGALMPWMAPGIAGLY